jgi:hypothetical protein
MQGSHQEQSIRLYVDYCYILVLLMLTFFHLCFAFLRPLLPNPAYFEPSVARA